MVRRHQRFIVQHGRGGGNPGEVRATAGAYALTDASSASFPSTSTLCRRAFNAFSALMSMHGRDDEARSGSERPHDRGDEAHDRGDEAHDRGDEA